MSNLNKELALFENDVVNRIIAFERQHGVEVSDIRVERDYRYSNYSVPPLKILKIKLTNG